VVFWEPNLNETDGDHQDFCRLQYDTAHREYPGDQCLTFGDGYPSWDWGGWDVRGYWREYGDFNFGGNESTSRQFRGDGEKGMLQQAWNFIWSYNHINRGYESAHRNYCGCGTWVMFDYNRGYYHKPCASGMMDIFRLPKYIWHFYRSQRDPELYGPVIFAATEWTQRESPCKIVVFSNCGEVELRVNGKTIERREKDDGPDTLYSDGKVVSLATVGEEHDRTGGVPFDGGNCRHMDHPPFTFFDIGWEPGTLEAVGYINGVEAARHIVRTPETPAQLAVSADFSGIEPSAGAMDLIFIRAALTDKNGTHCVGETPEIAFKIEGPGELVGANPVKVEYGIASILLRTFKAGEIKISASANGGEIKGDLKIAVKEAKKKEV
jgi:beta-galactosidase